MVSRTALRKSQQGFTLIEMIVVAAIVMVGSAVAIPVTMRMVNNARGDSAVVVAATFIESARNRAVSERRNMELTFPNENTIRIDRVEWPSLTRTLIATATLEGEQEFARAGLVDTEDELCDEDAEALCFTGDEPVAFTSDGSLIDQAGDVVNGTIFIIKPGNLETARAVTIWGVTGMVRTWKWRGSQWMQ